MPTFSMPAVLEVSRPLHWHPLVANYFAVGCHIVRGGNLLAAPGDRALVLRPAPTDGEVVVLLSSGTVATVSLAELTSVDAPVSKARPCTWKIGDRVVAIETILDEEREIARPGDVGVVVDKQPGFDPTVEWERTGCVSDATPGSDCLRLE